MITDKMITDKMIEAASIAYNQILLTQPEDCRNQLLAMKSALEAAEQERWLDISETPKDTDND